MKAVPFYENACIGCTKETRNLVFVIARRVRILHVQTLCDREKKPRPIVTQLAKDGSTFISGAAVHVFTALYLLHPGYKILFLSL